MIDWARGRGDSASGVPFRFLGVRFEDGKETIGVAVELEKIGGIETIRLSNEFVRRVVIFATLNGKMQLPNIFDNHLFAARAVGRNGARSIMVLTEMK